MDKKYNNLYKAIQGEMMADDESPEDISSDIKALFEGATQTEYEVMNKLLMILTGWSYESLTDMHK